MNTSQDSNKLASICSILQVKPGQDPINRAIEVMSQLKAAQDHAKVIAPITQNNTASVQNCDENWAMMQLIAIAKILGFPSDNRLENLAQFASTLMSKKK
jgi:RNase P/RNase MRP subunit p30